MNRSALPTWHRIEFSDDERRAMLDYIVIGALIVLVVIAAVVFLPDDVQRPIDTQMRTLSDHGR
jgi:hypothetical protein